MVHKCLKLLRAKDESDVRTLMALLDSFHFPMEEVVPEIGDVNEVKDINDVDGDDLEDPDNHEPSALSLTSKPQIVKQTDGQNH